MSESSIPVLSVSQFVQAVDDELGAFQGVVVEGEVAEFKIIHNKWVVFQLKDERCSVGCFMTVWNYKNEVSDGMTVRAIGRPRLREKGFFSLVVESMTPTGEGALKKALELLQKKLTAEGLFAPDRKRPLPPFPQRIGLITSRDAAAYSDFLKVLAARQGGLEIVFAHTQVQGGEAVPQMVRALERMNTEVKDLEVIVLIRGGGSLEDLMAFNDEEIVRAVAGSRLPIVVGVGHERDTTLAELAADLRASTPSNAAELLVRSRQDMAREISQMRQQLVYDVRDRLNNYRLVSKRLVEIMKSQTRTMAASLNQLTRVLVSLSPQKVLARGFSISKTPEGRVIKDAASVKPGEVIKTTLLKGEVLSIVKGDD